MKRTIAAIKTVRKELLMASNSIDKNDAAMRLLALNSQLAHEVIEASTPKESDWFLVYVGDQPGRVIGKLEHGHLTNWCSRKGIPLTSARIDEEMVNDLLSVLE